VLRSSADLQLYDSEFQTEGALTLSLTVLEILYVLCIPDMVYIYLISFLRATAGTAIARLSHRNSVCPSVRHTGGSGKNGAS